MLILAKVNLKLSLECDFRESWSCSTTLEIQPSISPYIFFHYLDPHNCLRMRTLDSGFTTEADFSFKWLCTSCPSLASCTIYLEDWSTWLILGHKTVLYLMLEQEMRWVNAQTSSVFWKSKKIFLEEKTVIMNMPVSWNASWWRCKSLR